MCDSKFFALVIVYQMATCILLTAVVWYLILCELEVNMCKSQCMRHACASTIRVLPCVCFRDIRVLERMKIKLQLRAIVHTYSLSMYMYL